MVVAGAGRAGRRGRQSGQRRRERDVYAGSTGFRGLGRSRRRRRSLAATDAGEEALLASPEVLVCELPPVRHHLPKTLHIVYTGLVSIRRITFPSLFPNIFKRKSLKYFIITPTYFNIIFYIERHHIYPGVIRCLLEVNIISTSLIIWICASCDAETGVIPFSKKKKHHIHLEYHY